MSTITQKSDNPLYSHSSIMKAVVTDKRAVIITIIAIPFLIYGIYDLVRKSRFTGTTTGKIQSSNYICAPIAPTKCKNNEFNEIEYSDCPINGSYKCIFYITYNIGDGSGTITKQFDIKTSKFYAKNQEVKLYYDPDSPYTTMTLDEPENYKKTGTIIIIVSIFLIILSWIVALLTNDFKNL